MRAKHPRRVFAVTSAIWTIAWVTLGGLSDWGAYWASWLLAGLLIPEVYGLIFRAAATLSRNTWALEHLDFGHPFAFAEWTWLHWLVALAVWVLAVWLSGHLPFAVWRLDNVPVIPQAAMDVLHSYTLTDINDLATRVVRNNRHWWPAGDRDDQHATAWHGIAEHLCQATERPSERDLLEAGRRALGAEVRDQLRHHGARADGTNNGTNFGRYWDWHSGPCPSPEPGIVDALAVRQITAALTGRQVEALTVLAACEDYALAARTLGIKPNTFQALLTRARREFYRLWHEGETPSRPWALAMRTVKQDTDDPRVLARRAMRAAADRKRRRAARLAAAARTGEEPAA